MSFMSSSFPQAEPGVRLAPVVLPPRGVQYLEPEPEAAAETDRQDESIEGLDVQHALEGPRANIA
ncbi:hypothetical protein [Actinoplanes regularis]|nr:hypothetical protein [Actinoplanes regularis]GIE90041.1 hypothetical protein Are01nite_65210 [Actinoplanes regularis]